MKGKYVLTPEAKALSSNFENNKGKLPWPTSKGVVTAYYGEHWHPVLKGIKIYNNGVDISTDAGGRARAVFEGEVSGVIVLPGSGKAVMVRHGAYISVYANLVDVFVQKGDKLTTKQEIGKAKTDQQVQKYTLDQEELETSMWLPKITFKTFVTCSSKCSKNFVTSILQKSCNRISYS